MTGLEKVLTWLSSSDENKKAFAENLNVVENVSDDLSSSDMAVIRKIHTQSVLTKTNAGGEVLGMRSYGWQSSPKP